jgi:hypothetical protein
MKGVLLTLEKDGVEVRTQHLGDGKIKWVDGPVDYGRVLGHGWKPIDDDVVKRALNYLHDMWDRFCCGRRLTNEEFMTLAKILRDEQ